MSAAVLLALNLVQFTGPDGQVILLDRDKVTTLRVPRDDQRHHFGPGIKCLIFTVDGKNINVVETCEQVRKLLEGGNP